MLFRAALSPVLECGNHRVRGTPRWCRGLGSGVGVRGWGQGQLSESLEKRRGMTSERPGSAALAVVAGAAGAGRGGDGGFQGRRTSRGASLTRPGQPRGGKIRLASSPPASRQAWRRGVGERSRALEGGKLRLRGRVWGSGAIPQPREEAGESWPRTPGLPHARS